MENNQYNNQYNQYQNNQTGADYVPQGNAPQYNQPVYEQPVYEQPIYEQTQYQQPQYEQPQYQQPMYQQPYQQPVKDDSKGMAITSLVCGILSVTCCCGGWLPSILALVFGIISVNRKKEQNGMAVAGIILGAIGLVISIILVATGTVTAFVEEMMYY